MFTFTGADGLRLHVHEWHPTGESRGIVHLAHGMGEHAGLYDDLAVGLSRRGFVVYAGDLRGHGLSIKDQPGRLGVDGWNLLVGELIALTELQRARHPGKPLVLVGHSMGSYAVQQVMLDHADLLDGAVLAGTTALDGLIDRLAGLPERITFYNTRFQPVRTPFDWLSRDEAFVDAFMADPLCAFPLDDDGMRDMYAAAPRLADPATVTSRLPLYVMVGDRDPLNDGLVLSDLLVQRYRAAGLADITYRTYPGARHHLFHETDSDEITADLVAWITRVTESRRPTMRSRQEAAC
ncbi:Lysophospholipase, alpha-beta hydrolase superfamily [Actinokineospora alba]|uniref:Lysophospholipase, alpha-beta hydrolase superfamily n=1 Tax=Actinokineospora alba TaxID=504798 RepID=A0A1H0LT99_9PSEU|nr:alpha/beta fold hydrolase [Actinokineospora alba]TDP67441.1 alpha-beta hydrolase superfamily lysophospholipase [Actinokineospora alba]SDI96568.1 Lysophospholipase, alpha-beta hydrolase superfamily [Actinokineospora alba]SDO71216.1 Lysophospholipase, alpha-beta hydrolase superfamily [Actinokineospora alba]